jgi:hypothetical protein
MKVLKDYAGRDVRLTEERRQHILEHPEMANQEAALEETLREPQLVIQSRTDETATLNYRWYFGTRVGDKWRGKIQCSRCIHPHGLSNGQAEKGRAAMANQVKIWFDAEGDFLEVLFSDAPGYMRETDNDAVMERVDEKGKVLGFSVMRVSTLAKNKPIVAQLAHAS